MAEKSLPSILARRIPPTSLQSLLWSSPNRTTVLTERMLKAEGTRGITFLRASMTEPSDAPTAPIPSSREYAERLAATASRNSMPADNRLPINPLFGRDGLPLSIIMH